MLSNSVLRDINFVSLPFALVGVTVPRAAEGWELIWWFIYKSYLNLWSDFQVHDPYYSRFDKKKAQLQISDVLSFEANNSCRNNCFCTKTFSLSSLLAVCVTYSRRFCDVLMILWHVRLHRSPLFGCHAMRCVTNVLTLYHSYKASVKQPRVSKQNRPMPVDLSS